jgi:hypothetical protein
MDRIEKNSNTIAEINSKKRQEQAKPKEIGGPKGPEPTRYGDWEKKGRCIDF